MFFVKLFTLKKDMFLKKLLLFYQKRIDVDTSCRELGNEASQVRLQYAVKHECNNAISLPPLFMIRGG